MITSATKSDTQRSHSEESSGPTTQRLNQTAASLSQWRGLLPRDLQWHEGDPAGYPNQTGGQYSQQLDPSLSPQYQNHPILPHFTTDLTSEPVHYQYVYDIQVALLRTRYYYTKFMAYRPFCYKALHYPESMTQEDAHGVAECLRVGASNKCCNNLLTNSQSCLKWPILYSPPSRRKRMMPFNFCWSQTFMTILIIFHMTVHNPMLRDIRAQFCGASFEAEVGQSIELMLDWIR